MNIEFLMVYLIGPTWIGRSSKILQKYYYR